ncbi:putative phosphomannomutase [Nymphon striatum]|nr:putative phosphomannomutase [Nymphon striatum]
MKNVFVFDVDGTLTPARQSIASDFENFFREFVSKEIVFLASGSDYLKLQKQVPIDILKACEGVFGCAGAQHYKSGNLVVEKHHEFLPELQKLCSDFVDASDYPHRTGNHIEARTGMLNISSVGRNANTSERQRYHKWDQLYGERSSFVKLINESTLPYEASAGGQISIDVVPIGWNKSVVKDQVLNLIPDARIIFFGDRMGAGGNDKPLADALSLAGEPHHAICVDGYKDTWREIVLMLKRLHKNDKQYVAA